MKEKIIPIILASLAVLAAVAGAGCTSNGSVEHYILNYASGVVGFTITLNVSVVVTQSAMYEDEVSGDPMHYNFRDYTVTTTATPNHDLDVTSVASRELANPRISAVQWDSVVGPWSGVPWCYGRCGSSDTSPTSTTTKVTTTETGSEDGEAVYDIPKPGKYITVLGYTWTFGEIIVNTVEQVPTFLKLKIAGLIDGSGLPYEFSIPFMAQVPEFTDSRSSITTWYEISFYMPVGGQLFEEIPDQFEIEAAQTVQHLRAGYDQDVSDSGDLAGFLLGEDLAEWGDQLMSSWFGSYWSSWEFYQYGGEIRPHPMEKIDPVPTWDYRGQLHAIVDVEVY